MQVVEARVEVDGIAIGAHEQLVERRLRQPGARVGAGGVAYELAELVDDRPRIDTDVSR